MKGRIARRAMNKNVRRGSFLINKNTPLLFALSVAAIFFLSNLAIKGPVYQGDEGGYLANASAISGNVADAASSCYAGYSFLLAPLFWISHDPRVVYLLVKLVNSVLWGLSALLVIGILRFTFPTARDLKILGTAVLGMLYPAWITLSGYAFSENAFIPIFLLSVYLAFCVVQKGKIWWIFWAVSLGYLFFIHPRAAPVIAAALLASILLLIKDWRNWRWGLAFLFIIAGMVALYWYVIGPGLIARMTIGDYAPSLQYPSAQDLLARFDLVQQLQSFLVRLTGQFFYITLATLGFVCYPFLAGMIRLYSGVKDRSLVKLAVNGNWPVYGFLALSFVGTMVLTAVFFITGDRFDQWLYGRYIEGVALPLLAVGFMLFSRKKAIFSLGILIASATLLILFMPTVTDYAVNINGLGLWQTVLLGYSMGGNTHLTIFYWTVAGVISFAFMLLVKNPRFRVYFFLLVYAVTIALQVNHHEYLTKGYVDPKLALRDFLVERYPAGSCLALYGDGFETGDYFQVYAFYFQEYDLIRLNLANWINHCNGPLLSTNKDVDVEVPNARAVVYNFVDKLIVWEKTGHEQGPNCLPGSCINLDLKDYPLTMVGRHFSGGVRTTGRTGFILVGPYVEMQAGSYILELHGNQLEAGGNIHVEVVDEGESRVFVSFEPVITSLNKNDVLLHEKVVLEEAANFLEIRVWVDSKADLELYNYTLTLDQ
jgi:hypothetical protein